ncbi:MAG: phasin family protein [Planktothrix sp.]|jgi:polyhydroxyalkanoate synthesis regulator phasin|uniref:phasin family protein n=1 Tax=Planktothrix sp. TaxID=3088171 RepID=UPI0038D3C642
MPGFGDLFQKAVYLGVGLASYAGEKASKTLAELRTDAQKLADELVKRGEMTTEEARRFVEETIQDIQKPGSVPPVSPPKSEPRRIEILEDEEPTQTDEGVETLRQKVQDLQEELRRLQQ